MKKNILISIVGVVLCPLYLTIFTLSEDSTKYFVQKLADINEIPYSLYNTNSIVAGLTPKSDDSEYGVNDFAFIEAKDVTKIYSNKKRYVVKISFENYSKKKIRAKIAALLKRKNVLSADPDIDCISFSAPLPNEITTSNWAVSKISLDKAWEVTRGNSSIRVGIMDSGVYASHPDLNGRVNTSLSHSFSPNSTNALDDAVNHGTGVASIVGGIGNNGNAVGLCYEGVDLISLRVDGESSGYNEIINGTTFHFGGYTEKMSCVIQALYEAEYLGIPVLNFSGGFAWGTTELYAAVNNYTGLLVCAAGNVDGGQYISNQSTPVYPGAYGLSNTLTVCGTSSANDVDSGSCYNSYVHIGAPYAGFKAASKPNSYISNFQGTSLSAPLVSGTAALMKAINPSLTTNQLKQIICDNVDVYSSLNNKCIYHGILNTYKSLKSAMPTFVSSDSPFSYNTALTSNQSNWYKIQIGGQGTYNISSSGATSILKCELYSNMDGNSLAECQGNNSNGNFSLHRKFLGSGTYYLKISNLSTASTTYSISFSSTNFHDYTNSYSWISNTKHRAFCRCGSFILQGHVVLPSNPNQCTICGGYASSGGLGPLSSDGDDIDETICPLYEHNHSCMGDN